MTHIWDCINFALSERYEWISPVHAQLGTDSWMGSRAGWWRKQHTSQRNAWPGMQTVSVGIRCETNFPSCHSTCPCHVSLSERDRTVLTTFHLLTSSSFLRVQAAMINHFSSRCNIPWMLKAYQFTDTHNEKTQLEMFRALLKTSAFIKKQNVAIVVGF